MRLLLLVAALLLSGALAACGSDSEPAETPAVVAEATSTPVPATEPAAPPTSEAQARPTPAEPATPTLAPEEPTPRATHPLAAVAAQAESEQEPEGDPDQGGVLQLLGQDPPTLDPHQTGDVRSSRYVLEVFGGLLTVNPELEIVADLAENWAIDADGMGYTFNLNTDATFHDGRRVTADDFKYSIERVADPATEAPGADTYVGDIVGVKDKLDGVADSVSGVTVTDDATLHIDLDAPKPYILAKLTYPASFVVDRTNVETGRDWVRTPNGTGPFKLAEYEPGVLMRLERFENYHLGPAHVDGVEFNLAGGDGLLMYENDEIHWGRAGLSLIEALQDPTHPLREDLHLGPPDFDVFYYGMNFEQPPFDDVKVRQALNYSIDRETLATVLLSGVVTPTSKVLPPGFPAYNPDLEGYPYDPEKARQLLAESTYGSDTSTYPRIVVTFPGSFGSPLSPLHEAILATWEEQLGITMDIQQTEWATYLQDLRERRFQIFGGLGWSADYLDAENFLDVLFHSESDNNHTGYVNAELDAILERARVEQDELARVALYNEAEQLIIEQAVWAPLYHSNGDSYIIKPYVKGLPLTPLVIPRLRYVYFTE